MHSTEFGKSITSWTVVKTNAFTAAYHFLLFPPLPRNPHDRVFRNVSTKHTARWSASSPVQQP